MSKKISAIKALPEGKVPDYGVSGVTPEQERSIREIVGDIAPSAYPTGGIAFLPADQYKNLTRQVERGSFMGHPIEHGDNSEESFGSQGSTHIGNGFSVRSMGRTWLNADLLNSPKQLRETLSHELGHFAASDASESAADDIKNKAYMPRLKAQEQLTKTVADLPSRTLGSALPPVEPLAPATQYLGSALPSPQNTPAAQPIEELQSPAKPDANIQSQAEEATARGKALSRR